MPSNGRVYAGGTPNFDESTGTYRKPGQAPAPKKPPMVAPKKKPGVVGRTTAAPSKRNVKPGQMQGVNKKGLPPAKSGPYGGPRMRGR